VRYLVVFWKCEDVLKTASGRLCTPYLAREKASDATPFNPVFSGT